jgi:hypothetical protein
MNCAYHTDVEVSAFCARCGKALCAPCVRQVRGSVYCEDCLAESVEEKARRQGQATQTIGGSSPEAAVVLGLIPGVGAIYNAEYFKAAIHILIFGSLVTIVDAGGAAETLFGLLAFGFYVYMPFEAYYTAKKWKLKRQGVDLETPFDQFNEQLGRLKNRELWGGVALIIVGGLFLLDNFGIVSIQRVAQLWPALLIAAGVFLIKRFQERAS